jgi:hypothetical protein
VYGKYTGTIDSSTLSNNYARQGGGALYFINGTLLISDSTISNNDGGGIVTDAQLSVINSTIAFNTQVDADQAAGVVALAGAGTSIVFESSIIANNISSIANFDLSAPNQTSIGGANNLIEFSTASIPADTISVDPILGPLADNGGLTLTHALLEASPAIDAGNNHGGLLSDQRGTGHARVSGSRADIGAFEVQNLGFVFANGFEDSQ